MFLSKRSPQGRDLLERPFGRFYNLPVFLSRQGHHVVVLVLSYGADLPEVSTSDGVQWISQSLRPFLSKAGALAFLRRAQRLIDEQRPDCLIAFSDTWYGIAGQWLAARNRIPCVIDAYDNYESYIPWGKPLHWAWRRACRRASAVTATGPDLLELMRPRGSPGSRAVVPMAADPGFRPMDMKESRSALGLPLGAHLIGYLGSLHRSRGIDTLFEAMREVLCQLDNVRFVVSGRRQRGVEFPADIRAHLIDLGFVADEKMPLVLNSLDLALVVNRDSKFGRYSYPVKLYEAMACRVPVVASNVPGSAWILSDYPELLARPEDAGDHAEKVMAALRRGQVEYSGLSSWDNSGALFEELLDNVIQTYQR